jgi:hypothetical protein
LKEELREPGGTEVRGGALGGTAPSEGQAR